MKGTVAVLKTCPKSILDDYERLMHLAQYKQFLSDQNETIIKLNLSWTKYFPACSTEPWQLEGVLKTLLEDGYKKDKLYPVENKTVVTDPIKGAKNNNWISVLDKHDLPFIPLTQVKWIKYEFNSDFLIMDKIFPEGILIPELFVEKNILHLPTVKTHGHNVITGAIKNSFGGLLQEVRHYCHKYIHETLVDLMLMQNEIHTGIFTVMDGTIAGDRAGPRTMVPKIKNVILASGDSVAIDATAAKLMGFEPLQIPYIRMCHERRLGIGDPNKIEMVGDTEVMNGSWNFKVKRSFVIWGDQMVRKGPLRFLEKIALHSPFMLGASIASNIYHDWSWYPIRGKRIVHDFMRTEWGKLFQTYARKESSFKNKECETIQFKTETK